MNYHHIKRMMLLTIILPLISLIPGTSLDFTRSTFYTTPTTLIAAYTLLINFPNIIELSHTLPLTFQDLEAHTRIYPHTKKISQLIFTTLLQVFSALTITSIVNYYMYRYTQTELSFFEITGVLGGFIALLSKIENITGNTLLSLLNRYDSPQTRFQQNNQISTYLPDYDLNNAPKTDPPPTQCNADEKKERLSTFLNEPTSSDHTIDIKNDPTETPPVYENNSRPQTPPHTDSDDFYMIDSPV